MSKKQKPQQNQPETAKLPELRFPEFQTASAWEEKKIGDLFDLESKPEKIIVFDRQKVLTVKLHTLGVVKNEKTDTLTGGANYFKREAGEFIFSKIDLLNGAFGLVSKELNGFCSSSDIPAFPFKAGNSPIFFLNWLKRNYKNLSIERTGTSSTLKRVSTKNFLNIPILLPNSKEQQKIADCLTALDKQIAAQSEKTEHLKAHKKGLMQRLFPAN